MLRLPQPQIECVFLGLFFGNGTLFSFLKKKITIEGELARKKQNTHRDDDCDRRLTTILSRQSAATR